MNENRSIISKIYQLWANLVARGAWAIVVIAFVSAWFAFTYARNNLGINTDTAEMISPELSFRKTFADYEQAFPNHAGNVVIVVEADTPEFADQAVRDLVELLKGEHDIFEDAYLPAGGPFIELNGLLFLDYEKLQDLADNLAKAQPFLAALFQDQSLRGLFELLDIAVRILEDDEKLNLDSFFLRIDKAFRKTLDGEPYYLSWQDILSDKDSEIKDRRRFIMAKLRFDYNKLLPAERALDTIHTWGTALAGDGTRGIRIRVTGAPALGHEEILSLMKGSTSAGIVSLILVFLSLLIGFRSLPMVFATIVSLVVGILYTAAFATWAIGHLNLISIAFAVLYIGLGVDYGIHFCLRYHVFSTYCENRLEALHNTIRYMAPALGICTLSTAIGFYAFVPTAYLGVSELGLISGTGMFISFIISMTFLPAMLHLLPKSQKMMSAVDTEMADPNFLQRLPIRYSRPVSIVSALIIAGTLFLLPKAYFDYDPIKLRDPHTESVQILMDMIADTGKHPSTIIALASSAEETKALGEQLEALPKVDRVVSILTYLPDDQAKKLILIGEIDLILGLHILDSSLVIPPTAIEQRKKLNDFLITVGNSSMKERSEPLRKLEATLIEFNQRLDSSKPETVQSIMSDTESSLLATLPFAVQQLRTALSATESFSLNAIPASIKDLWVSRDERYRMQVFPATDISDNLELERFVTAVRSVIPNATAGPVFIYESGRAIVASFKQAFASAFVLVLILLFLIFRNAIDPFLVLVPLIVAGIITGAATVAFNIPFNFANIIAIPLLLGLGVDNGVHLVHRLHDPQLDKSRLLATSTARGIFFSALTTIFSFGTLAFLSHRGTSSMGQLLTIGVFLTMAVTLIVLPAFLFLPRRLPKWLNNEDKNEKDVIEKK